MFYSITLYCQKIMLLLKYSGNVLHIMFLYIASALETQLIIITQNINCMIRSSLWITTHHISIILDKIMYIVLDKILVNCSGKERIFGGVHSMSFIYKQKMSILDWSPFDMYIEHHKT